MVNKIIQPTILFKYSTLPNLPEPAEFLFRKDSFDEVDKCWWNYKSSDNPHLWKSNQTGDGSDHKQERGWPKIPVIQISLICLATSQSCNLNPLVVMNITRLEKLNKRSIHISKTIERQSHRFVFCPIFWTFFSYFSNMADLAKSFKKIDFFDDHSQFIKNVYDTFLVPVQISVF
jgi:hypothetical protein